MDYAVWVIKKWATQFEANEVRCRIDRYFVFGVFVLRGIGKREAPTFNCSGPTREPEGVCVCSRAYRMCVCRRVRAFGQNDYRGAKMKMGNKVVVVRDRRKAEGHEYNGGDRLALCNL